jgi:hypothetical protein
VSAGTRRGSGLAWKRGYKWGRHKVMLKTKIDFLVDLMRLLSATCASGSPDPQFLVRRTCDHGATPPMPGLALVALMSNPGVSFLLHDAPKWPQSP